MTLDRSCPRHHSIVYSALGATLLGLVGASVHMRIHLPEAALRLHEANFLSAVRGIGAAPDQYRVLQLYVAALLYELGGFYFANFALIAASLAGAIFTLLELVCRTTERPVKV